MSVTIDNMAVMGYANGFTMWHYKTTEHKGNLLQEHYFDSMKTSLMRGDIIMVATEIAGDMKINTLFVSNIDNTGVKIKEAKN